LLLELMLRVLLLMVHVRRLHKGLRRLLVRAALVKMLLLLMFLEKLLSLALLYSEKFLRLLERQ
jgi:hypothetical protein